MLLTESSVFLWSTLNSITQKSPQSLPLVNFQFLRTLIPKQRTVHSIIWSARNHVKINNNRSRSLDPLPTLLSLLQHASHPGLLPAKLQPHTRRHTRGQPHGKYAHPPRRRLLHRTNLLPSPTRRLLLSHRKTLVGTRRQQKGMDRLVSNNHNQCL